MNDVECWKQLDFNGVYFREKLDSFWQKMIGEWNSIDKQVPINHPIYDQFSQSAHKYSNNFVCMARFQTHMIHFLLGWFPRTMKKCWANPGEKKNHHNFEHQLDPIGGFHSHGATQNRWLIIENTIEMDDLGVPQFQTPIDVLFFPFFREELSICMSWWPSDFGGISWSHKVKILGSWDLQRCAPWVV